MSTHQRTVITGLLLCGAARVCTTQLAPASGIVVPIVIQHVTLIDGTGRAPVTDAAVVVEGERIRAVARSATIPVPRGSRIIDGQGRYVLPGLIDCHCHMDGVGFGDAAELPAAWNTREAMSALIRANAQLDLFGGVTTVRDLGSGDDVFVIKREIDSGKTAGPRILAAGHQLVKRAPNAFMSPRFVEYDGVDEARARVREQVALGADWIKVRLTRQRPTPSVEELRAIVDEAQKLGRRVAVHTDVPADGAVRLAVEANVGSIEHNAPLRVADTALIVEMSRRHIGLVAGLGSLYVQRLTQDDTTDALDSLPRSLLPAGLVVLFTGVMTSVRTQASQMKRQGWDPAAVQARSRDAMRRALDAGVVIGFGTDCGAELMVHGQQYRALYGETQMGLTPMQAIVAATRDAARVIGTEADLGTIEPGKLADVIMVDANPLADIRNLRHVLLVMKGGVVYREPPVSTIRSRHNR